MRWPSLLLIVAAIGCSDVARAAERQRQVLVVHSNRRDAPISIRTDRQLPRLLDDGPGLDYYSEYLDRPRFSEPDYQTAFRNFLQLKYKDQRFDLVVAIQDNAVEFVRANRKELFPDTPVVFFGNHDPGPIANATGIVVQIQFQNSMIFAAALQPDLEHVFVVSGAGKAERGFESDARAQLERAHTRLSFTYLSGLPTKDLETRLKSLPPKSAVYMLLVYQDGAGENFHQLEYVDRVLAAASVPTYSWVDSTMGHGVVGGSFVSLDLELDALGGLARRVLHGEAAGAIPAVRPDVAVPQVDWRQLRRWNIDEARVPAGTLVQFKERDIWDRFRVYIIGALLIVVGQSFLIGGLLIQRTRRRQAEQRTRDLGGRLLLAQEDERARIARDLHDDVSQQLALLTLELDLLRTAAPGDADNCANEAFDRAQTIASSIHGVLRQLHPTRLKMLGLVAALQGLCRDLSQPDFAIAFSHDNVPAALPEEIGLCLFRVAQEAIQNTMKHSHAHHASVHLRGDGRQLTLTTGDDGIGFDVNAAWGTGLGLVSMRERLELVDGVLRIRSHAGGGTWLTATVPIQGVDSGTRRAAHFAPDELARSQPV
jgi:signal transduction histidine kinase